MSGYITMKVNRVERHVLKKNHPMYKIIDQYCLKSKNLYNFANYILRQSFFKENNYITYMDLTKNIKHSEPFKDIGSNSGQHTLKILDKNWKSFFVSIKDWSKNKNKYLGKPNVPRYLPKNGRFIFFLTNIQSKIKDGYLSFSFKPLHPYNNLIKTSVEDKHLQTRFIPKGDHYVMEIVYEKEIQQKSKNSERIIGIDLGINRFITVQNNINLSPFAINGNSIKSINNYYNKKVAYFRGIAKKTNNLDWTNRLQKLTTKRNNKLILLSHKISKTLVDYCIKNKIDTVVIGYNEKWKQKVSLYQMNQHFVSIPFEDFVSKLEYKLLEKNIKLIKTEESFTSKANCLNLDEMKSGVNFTGKRVKRGLYKTHDGIKINADVNGATNIIRKVFPNAFADGIKDVGLHPVIINIR